MFGQAAITLTVPGGTTAPLSRSEYDALLAAASERQQAIEDAARRLTHAARVQAAYATGELQRPLPPPPPPPSTRGWWLAAGLVAVGAGLWAMKGRRRHV